MKPATTLAARAALPEAERVKQWLEAEGLLDHERRYEKEEGYIYFPVRARADTSLPVTFVERELQVVPKKQTLRELLAGRLTNEELERLKTSYDVVGSIAILEVDDELAHRKREIADAVLATQKNVKTVLAKAGGHGGSLRTQTMRHLAGNDTRETVVRENGVRLTVDVERVYYSVRSATERKRIASLVEAGERVLVMFSGAAPYPCVIAKRSDATEVVGIELNERGHELGVENVRANKLENVTLIHGDVRDVVPALKERGIMFDRIVMPLPHTGEDFLDEAFMVAKEGAVIHLYDFEHEEQLDEAAEKARRGAERNTRRVTILGVTACGQHSPRVYRVCCDFRIVA